MQVIRESIKIDQDNFEQKVTDLNNCGRLFISSLNEEQLLTLLEQVKTNTSISSIIFNEEATIINEDTQEQSFKVENNFTDKVAKALADILRSNSPLLDALNFYNINISTVGQCDIYEALKFNHTIRYLTFKGMSWSQSQYALNPQDAKTYININLEPLAEMLKVNESIKHLYINNITLSDKGLEQFAEAIANNNKLTLLSLNLSLISDEGAQFLAKSLKSNSTIKELYLDTCSLKDKGIEYLTAALTENEELKVLSLSSNLFTAKGLELLSNSLKNNSSLIVLDIDNTKVESKEFVKFIEALKSNNSIHYLSLEQNNLTDEVAEAIARFLKIKPYFNNIGIRDNNFTDQGWKHIAEALEKHIYCTGIGIWDIANEEIKAYLARNSKLEENIEYIVNKSIRYLYNKNDKFLHSKEEQEFIKQHLQYIKILHLTGPSRFYYSDKDRFEVVKPEDSPIIKEINQESLNKLASMLNYYFGQPSEAESMKNIEIYEEYKEYYKSSAQRGEQLLTTKLCLNKDTDNSLELVKEFLALPYDVMVEKVAPYLDKDILDRFKQYSNELLVSYEFNKKLESFIDLWQLDEAIEDTLSIAESVPIEVEILNDSEQLITLGDQSE
jgi:Ran GTPase-activating protein (RanGAP) involved in mRNA processing and transport